MQNDSTSKKKLLLKRLDEIAESLKCSNMTLALLGLGSVGVELDRLDEYSDLDFFVIVKDGYKESFIKDLSWLSDVYPIAFSFQNTKDGYKSMFADDIFCEFAVFETKELINIPYVNERIVWQSEKFDLSCLSSKSRSNYRESSVEYLIGELLTNLYVGLNRYLRGEKLSAFKFVQCYAFDRLIELLDYIKKEENSSKRDLFSNERRVEQRFQDIKNYLSTFAQGYDKTKESAIAIINFIDSNFKINSFMKEKILNLCDSINS